MRKVEIHAPDKNMNGNTLEITITNEIIDNNIIVVNPYYKIVARGQHSQNANNLFNTELKNKLFTFTNKL